MADPFSTGAGIVGVIGLTIQITQALMQFGVDWKNAPHDVKAFMAELQTLKTTLSETNTNLLLNPDFAEAFANRPSLLLSQLGPNASPTTDGKMMLKTCEEELKSLLHDLKKRAEGHRVGWERIKGAFLSKGTRQSVENLQRQCQALNNMVSIDTAMLGLVIHTEVKDARREQQDVRKEQQEMQQAETAKELLSWLSTADYGSQQSDLLSQRQEGTGNWLLNSEEFRHWCNGEKRTLYCPGMPGAGKTIIASTVVDFLSNQYRHATKVCIAYLYCNFRRKDEQRPVDLLASLLKQLLSGLPAIPDSMRKLYEHHRDKKTRPSLDEISKELIAVANLYSKCFVIVDALDECQVTDGGRRKLLSELFHLQDMATVSLLATSRFIPEIASEFAGKCASLEIHASDEDVRKYLDSQMTRLPSFVLRNADLQEEIKTEIVKAVQGMFLLAKLHLESLIGSKSIKTLKKSLRDLPKGSIAYDHAYTEAMGRIQGQIPNSRELAKQVLSWITCAKRPLTTLELQHALAVEPGEPELDEDNLPEVEDMVSTCAGLVIVDEESDVIRLIHYTTQEFLERTWKEWFPNAQNDITTTCITYLSFDVFESGFCQSDKEFEDRLRLHRLYDYAARNWSYHNHETTGTQCSIPTFFGSEAKVSACSQALMVRNGYYNASYSQRVPQKMTVVHLAAWLGLSGIMGMLLEVGYDSDRENAYRRTPLSYAAKNGHETIVRLLLKRDDVEADSKNKKDRTPLSYAAEKGYETIVRLLLKRDDVETNSKDEMWGRTPLSYAAEDGHETIVRLLLKRDDVEADSKNEREGRTPLSYAAENGHETIVRLLLERDDVEADSKNEVGGRTPLFYAVENGHETIVRLLLKRDDVETDSKDLFFDRTPLSWAAGIGHDTIVRLLLKRDDVEKNSKDWKGRTPLSWATENGHEAIVRLLLERDDVDTTSKDRKGRTPLTYAVENGHETIVRLLQEHGCQSS